MASNCEDNRNDETLPNTGILLDKTRDESLDSSAAGANVTYVVDKTNEAIPKDATFIITDDNNNNEVKQQQRVVRKKKGNREGTPLSSMLDDFASKGVVPKRLADITNMTKANDSVDDSNSFFKVPMRPARPVPGLRKIDNKKEISFDDLNSEDETDVESNQEKRAQIFPQWSLDYQRMKCPCKQAHVNFDGEPEVPRTLIVIKFNKFFLSVSNAFFSARPIVVDNASIVFPSARSKDLERNDSSCWED